MPVMELSKIMTVEVPLLYTISIKPVTPECKKVESPSTATDCRANSLPRAFSIPCCAEMLAPIQIMLSILSSGLAQPKE